MVNTGIKLPDEGERLAERYTIIARVSLGGFGAVYRAMQDTLGREVAIKVLLPEVTANNQDYVEQFRQEALLTSQLRHPNTITIFDYGQTDSGLLFLVMEWLEGLTLSDALRSEGSFSYERCYHISFQILKSLAEAHDRGMVHRDLKPSNLFLSNQYGETDFVKVLDFGLVKNLGGEPLVMRGKTLEPPRFTEKRRAPGTPHYMAPEQATGKGTTTSADIYSFGLILHEMLTGQRAVDGADKMEVLLRQAREAVPPLPEALQNTFLGRIVARCVEKDPLKRPQKAGVLVREYQRVEDTGGVEVSTADIRTTSNWRPLARPRNQAAEITSGPEEVFVGRAEELEEFGGLLEKGLSSGNGLVMTVSGPTGIGKTSLVRKFSEIFLESGSGMVINGGFLPSDQMPLSAFRRALRAFLQVQTDDLSEGRHQIRRALERYNVNDIYLLNFLTHFLLSKAGGEGDDRDECAARIEDFLDRLAQRSPLLMVIENLNWADADSLDLMWRLAVSPVIRQRAVFLTATFRSHERMDNRELQLVLERFNRLDHTAYRELRVGWLGKRDCMQIINSAINMQRTMANRCLALSKGNPLFLNLVLRYIIDEAEHISRQAADPAGLGSKLYLPSSLEKISLRRIDQVVRKYGQDLFREVLRRAALVGENFSVAAVEAVLRKEGQYEYLDRASRTLEIWRREGLLRRPWDSERSMEFVHPHLVEFFATDSEASLHLLVARTKEQMAQEAGGGLDQADLAGHYRAAGEHALAVRYLDAAANTALERNNFSKAKALYEAILPLLDLDSAQGEELGKRVYYDLGEICRRLSEYGPADDYLANALVLAQRSGDSVTEGRCYCGKADLALAQNRLDDADGYFHRARALISEVDEGLQGRLLLGMGRVSSLKGDWEAAQSCFQRAYDFGAGGQSYDLMARSLHELGRTALELGNFRAAHEWFGQAQKYYRSINSSADEADVLLDLAKTAYLYRRVEDARDCIERAIEIEQRLGDPLGVAHGQTALGDLEASLFHVDEAQKFVLRALTVIKEHNDRQGSADSKVVLSTLEMLLGHYEKAATLAQQALEEYQEIGSLSRQAHVMGRLGRLALLQGDYSVAEEQLGQAVMLLDVHSSDAYRAEILCDLGLLGECQGDFSRAEAYYQSAFATAQRGEWLERQQLARVAQLRVGLLLQPGRWYYDELWEIANEARAFGMRSVQLEALLHLAWFEGVYGDQPGWEAVIAELNHTIRLHRMPLQGILRTFDVIAEVVRHCAVDVAGLFRRSAGWIRQCVTQGSTS